MRKKHVKFCDSILCCMRSVFGLPFDTPVVAEEWLGDDGAGARDYISSLLRDAEKRAFMNGYARGVIDSVHDMNESSPISDVYKFSVEGNSSVGGERSFLKWEEE